MKEKKGNTFKVKDQLGNEIEMTFPPQRIISTVPSQTELFFDLGLDEKIVGVTWFCIHPKEKIKSKTKIGGTKNLKIDVIKNLKPDLIIANKEENEKAQIEELIKEFPVWISDIKNLEDAYEMMNEIGRITNTKNIAETLIEKIKNGFNELPKLKNPKTAIYLIWKDPYMSIGNDTFIHQIIEKIGLKNILDSENRYPVLTVEQIKNLNPEIILLSSEPYPFKEKHIKELQLILPEAKILLVDGEMFSWYGSRLQYAPEYLRNLITDLNN